jgi:uncharacterized LabA/DUF88 family protein
MTDADSDHLGARQQAAGATTMAVPDTGKETAPERGAVGPADQPLAGCDLQTSGQSVVAQAAVTRVRVYIDGFNLYYGLHDRFRRRYLWLDLRQLAGSPLKEGQILHGVHYFTARRRANPLSQANQAEYLGALRVRGVEVIEGRFQAKTISCNSCGISWTSYEEKETDVNLAVRLVEDALTDRFDLAVLITADSDMIPALKAVRRQRPELKIIAVAPPARRSSELERAADGHLRLSDAKIRQAQLPDAVHSPGRTYHRPERWK